MFCPHYNANSLSKSNAAKDEESVLDAIFEQILNSNQIKEELGGGVVREHAKRI